MLRVAIAMMVSALIAGCSSPAAAPAAGSIEVALRFENVRKQPGFDEWVAIRTVLEKHAPPPVVGEPSAVRRFGDTEIRDYRVALMLPAFADLDRINADLAALAGLRIGSVDGGSQRVEFSLSDVGVRYRGNYVAAGLNVTVSGMTSPRFVVLLYLREGDEPVRAVADRRGAWSVRISVIPEARYIYGSSEDPEGRLRPKYFRIGVTTLRHETISEAEFLANRPEPKRVSRASDGEESRYAEVDSRDACPPCVFACPPTVLACPPGVSGVSA